MRARSRARGDSHIGQLGVITSQSLRFRSHVLAHLNVTLGRLVRESLAAMWARHSLGCGEDASTLSQRQARQRRIRATGSASSSRGSRRRRRASGRHVRASNSTISAITGLCWYLRIRRVINAIRRIIDSRRARSEVRIVMATVAVIAGREVSRAVSSPCLRLRCAPIERVR